MVPLYIDLCDRRFIFFLGIHQKKLCHFWHTLALFKSYRMTEMVYQELIERMEDFPLFSMGKGRSVREKLESMMSGENDLTTHLNDGYVVRVHFGQEDYSATDALKRYLKQIAELKY